MIKLAIVTTHPIQYNAPWFQLLAKEPELKVKVFYTWSQSKDGSKYDPGFKRVIEWDIPLLEGYDFEFVNNTAKNPGSHHFFGINNPTLNKQVQSWTPDALLIIGWSYRSHLFCMRYFKGKIPVLFRGDSTLLDEKPGIKKIVRRFFLKYVYSHIDYALYVGTNNKNYFLKHGMKDSQLWYVPHAIDNDRFHNAERAEEKAKEWRSQLSISNENFVILFAGKLEQKKNPFYILQLAKHLPSENFKFIIAGNGPLENSLKEAASQDKRIIFLDFQNQLAMPVLYRICDVFILPSNGPGETWGLAINEAMACGKIVIASDKVGCAIDLIKPKQNGIILRHSSNEAVDFLKDISENRSKLMDLGSKSRKIIESFSFQAIVNNTHLLLKKIYP